MRHIFVNNSEKTRQKKGKSSEIRRYENLNWVVVSSRFPVPVLAVVAIVTIVVVVVVVAVDLIMLIVSACLYRYSLLRGSADAAAAATAAGRALRNK